jgi:hypothetical protein
MNIQYIKDTADKFGLQATVQDIAYRAANKITSTLILRGMKITMDTLDPSYLEDKEGYDWGFVDREKLLFALTLGADKEMDARFIERALDKGDRCYGALDGDKLVSFGWYSTRPTAVSDELLLHFDTDYAYMYKGYTLPEYRGKRLHGIGMARALRAYTEEGQKGLVSYVESTNFASLKSCYRMGYQDFGQIFCIKLGESYVIHGTKGCDEYLFRLQHVGPGLIDV